ncbi:MAG: hypothetical protein HFJ52_08060 [Clostridia bacterium]|jgi:chromosome segregation ATPase|nr:hypothetical protein [Clostridia bacterium]
MKSEFTLTPLMKMKKFLRRRRFPMAIKTNAELIGDIDELKQKDKDSNKRLNHLSERVDRLEVKTDRVDKSVIELRGSVMDLSKQMNEKFEDIQEQMDKRFESMQNQMDYRFKETNDKLDNFMQELRQWNRNIEKRLNNVEKLTHIKYDEILS